MALLLISEAHSMDSGVRQSWAGGPGSASIRYMTLGRLNNFSVPHICLLQNKHMYLACFWGDEMT